jgi:tRNA(adenine34) deaminase
LTDSTKTDHEHMGKALAQAGEALSRGEFPVGCVVVKNGRTIASGARTGSTGPGVNELDHAEIVALRSLASRGTPLALTDAAIYCTMEPCLMCFGAILLAGIRRIVYAYEDVMGGGASVDLQRLRPLYRDRETEIVAGIRRAEGLALFQRFFQDPDNVYWRGSLLAQYTLGQNPRTGR